MKTYARIQDGVVAELLQVSGDISDMFHADLIWADCTAVTAVAPRWTYDGKIFSAPVAPSPTIPELLVYANEKQWALVLGGYVATISGGSHRFSCDGTAAAFMSSKLKRLDLPNPPASFKWQLLTGDFVVIQAADFLPLTIKLEAFVQDSFDTCATLTTEIMGGAVTSYAEIDGAAWPANHD